MREGPWRCDGAIDAARIIRAGSEIIRDNAVEDPAIRIGQELAQSLTDRHGLPLLAAAPPVSQADDVTAYCRTDWDNYRVFYSARLRVIDGQQKAVIAEGFCSYRTECEDPNKAPAREDLVGNNAEDPKRELAKAADYCIAFFRSNTFRT